jgi:hypothetical protein
MNTFPTQPGRSAEAREESAEAKPESTVKLVWPRAAAALAGLAFALAFAGFASAGSDHYPPVSPAHAKEAQR